VRAAAAAMIGDSLERDIEGARAAGLHAVWLSRRTPAGTAPRVPIDTLHELPEALASA
jgi:FMN phosphatase YigB (HAD superfamily)